MILNGNDLMTRLNDNDSYPSISSIPLIEDEEPNPTITPNFVYICMFLDNVKFFRCFE